MSLRPPTRTTAGRLNAVLALGQQIFHGDLSELKSKVAQLHVDALNLEEIEKRIPLKVTGSTQYKKLANPPVQELRSAATGLQKVLARYDGDAGVERLAFLSYEYLSADIKRTHELVTYILTKSLQSHLGYARLTHDQGQIQIAEQAKEEAERAGYWNETELDYDTGGLFETDGDDDPVYRQPR
jgi:hypothetical protein